MKNFLCLVMLLCFSQLALADDKEADIKSDRFNELKSMFDDVSLEETLWSEKTKKTVLNKISQKDNGKTLAYSHPSDFEQ